MIDMDFINKWLAALESGKYYQTQQRLRNGNSFCCLGVACDLEDPSKWNDKASITDYLNDIYWGGDDIYPPVDISVKLGLGIVIDNKMVSRLLSSKNDSGSSFKEIAYYYRKELLPLILEKEKAIEVKVND